MVPRIPLRRFDVPEVFRLASSPLSIESGSSSLRLRALFRDPNRVPLSFPFDGKPSAGCGELPPLRFPAPSADTCSANRLLSGSTQTPSLFDLSQILEGFILAELCRLVSSCCRSWGSTPSELFPADQLCQARHLVIPSRRFVLRPMVDGCAPRGFRTSAIRHPSQECCILSQAAALMGFQPLSRCSCVSGSIRLATCHPLVVFPSIPYETCSKSAFSVFYP